MKTFFTDFFKKDLNSDIENIVRSYKNQFFYTNTDCFYYEKLGVWICTGSYFNWIYNVAPNNIFGNQNLANSFSSFLNKYYLNFHYIRWHNNIAIVLYKEASIGELSKLEILK